MDRIKNRIRTGMTMTVPSAISRFQFGSRLDRSMEAARERV